MSVDTLLHAAAGMLRIVQQTRGMLADETQT